MKYEVKLHDKYSTISLFVETKNQTKALEQFFDYFKDKIDNLSSYEIEIIPLEFISELDFLELRRN